MAGRGGPSGWRCRLRHGAVGPQGAARNCRSNRLLGGPRPPRAVLRRRHRPRASVEDLLAQTDGNLAKGFRAIKTKVGRDCCTRTSSASGRCAASSATASR
jgi:hypothetical protein